MSRAISSIDVLIHGLAIDEKSGAPIVLLRDRGKRVLLPIWIGNPEARAILIAIRGPTTSRPMTHDLLIKMADACGAQVIGVDIRALEDGTFLGDLRLRGADDAEIRVDCRPSDGIAATLRAKGQIRVAADVLSAAHPFPGQDGGNQETQSMSVSADDTEGRERLEATLADLLPEELGDFEM